MDQKKLVSFLGFWVANTITILLASAIFGNNIVLGNDKISGPLAAVTSGLILTAVILSVPILVAKSGNKIKDRNVWAAIFFVANVAVLWVIKRVAMISGLGISSIVWVIVLALIMVVVQWAVARATDEMATLKK